MTSVGIEKEVFTPLCDVVKSSIADVRRSPVENFSFAFLSSPNFLDFLYRIVYFTESVESAEEIVRLWLQLKQSLSMNCRLESSGDTF